MIGTIVSADLAKPAGLYSPSGGRRVTLIPTTLLQHLPVERKKGGVFKKKKPVFYAELLRYNVTIGVDLLAD